MIKQIGLPLRGRSILLISRIITDQIVLIAFLLFQLLIHTKRKESLSKRIERKTDDERNTTQNCDNFKTLTNPNISHCIRNQKMFQVTVPYSNIKLISNTQRFSVIVYNKPQRGGE